MIDLSNDTICAPATADGTGGIAVIRISGQSAFEIADAVLKQRRSCRAYRGYTLHRAEVVSGSEVIDDVMVSVFHGPKSFTGEDIVEISCHGGRLPVAKTVSALVRQGCRLAGPGEFTRRAYLNGKMDLAAAEAVCDVINARTDEAYRHAVSARRGELSRSIEGVRNRILAVIAAVEASIDFPEDVGDLDEQAARQELAAAFTDLEKLLRTADRGMIQRNGASVVLVGRPNVGKSSLMNRILRHDRAIVTPHPGTTRDTLEETVDIKGIPVRLSDTAGLRPATDPVEALGVERTRRVMETADLIVLVIDSFVGVSNEDYELVAMMRPERLLEVWNKSDLKGAGELRVSAATGAGMELLETEIAARLAGGSFEESAPVALTHAHQKRSVETGLECLRQALWTIDHGLPPDLFSGDLRAALTCLDEITGSAATDDLMNEIFSRFCIGK